MIDYSQVSAQVYNSAFIAELGRLAPDGHKLWVTSFTGSPDLTEARNWYGHAYVGEHDVVDLWADRNSYYAVASLVPTADGQVRRRKANFGRLLALVADDATLEDVQGHVSYVIETSPGKNQVGIFINRDDEDAAKVALVDAVLAAFIERGYVRADASGNNAVRFVRLPVGQNQKPRDSGPWAHKLTLWRPDVVLSLADAAAAFGVDLDAIRGAAAQKPAQDGGAVGGQEETLRLCADRILNGESLHESIIKMAASLVAGGTHGGAAVLMIRALMDRSAAPRDERWRARYQDIPRAVSTAEEKFRPKHKIDLSGLGIGSAEQASDEPDPRTLNTTPEIVSGPKVDIRPMPVQGLNELAQWIYETTPNAHMLLAQAAALAVAGACAGRRYVSEYKDPASLYIGMLAPTASQARPMLTAAEQALTDTNLRHLVRSQRFNSTQQLYTAFMRSSSLFYAADDWGDQLAHAKRQPSGLLSICHGVIAGRVHLAHDIVLDNWVEVGLTKRPEDAPVAHTPTLYKPALTLLASIAEAQMRVAFKRGEFGRGALDCMLFVPALNVDGWSDRPVAVGTELPATVRARMLEIRGIPVDIAEMPEPKVDSILIRPTPLIVRFACDLASAERRWIERGRKLPPPLRPLAWGYRTTMRRACVAMAAFADPAQPLVTQDMLDWADRLVSQCLDITLSEVALLGGDDDDKPDAGSKLLEALVRAGPEGMAQRDLHKYCSAYRRLSTEDRKEVLGRLLSDDEITDINTQRGGKRYVARQFVVDTPVKSSGGSK